MWSRLFEFTKFAQANRITVKDSPGEGILLFDDNVILDGFNIQNCNGNGVHTGQIITTNIEWVIKM